MTMAKRFLYVWAGLLMLAALLHPSAEAGVISFASGPSWNATAMNLDESVGASLGPAECYSIPVLFDTAQIPGACCVWLPGWTPQTPADMVGAFFSNTLFVPGAPVSGTIWVAVDDWVQVSVNGVIVCSRGSITDINTAYAAQNPPQAFDLTPALIAGANAITVWARNGPGSFAGCSQCPWLLNGAWVYFGGSIAYDSATPARYSSWGTLKAKYR
jgi:hypothetical protein